MFLSLQFVQRYLVVFCIFAIMKFLYNCIVFISALLLPIIGVFHKKIKLFIHGRSKTFSEISKLKNFKTIWLHVVSQEQMLFLSRFLSLDIFVHVV